MAISKLKRRYSITMRPEIVDRFQTLARQIGLPHTVMSSACEEALKTMSDVFQIAKDSGTVNISDIHHLIGQQMELIEKEGKARGEQKKREKVKVDAANVKPVRKRRSTGM